MSSKSKNSKPNAKKQKLSKLINNSEMEEGETEKELSFYINDRVKLMKEVLKIIKPRKIRSMAPNCIKDLDNDEINSMLLEELLGISNKRLRYIFNGQNLDEDSSTEPEEEENPADIISLDDISDDEFVIDLDSDNEGKSKRCKKHRKIKVEPKKIKKEKHKVSHLRSSKDTPEVNEASEQNLMSVLELLELQARARAIRSQLALENQKKAEEMQKVKGTESIESDDNDDAVIITCPKNEEIIITSSDSENESSQISTINENTCDSNNEPEKSVKDGKSQPAEQEEMDVGRNTEPRTETENQAIEKDDQGSTSKVSNNIIIHQNDIVLQSSKESITAEIPLPECPLVESSSTSDKRKRHRKCRHKNRERSTSNASDQIVEKRSEVLQKEVSRKTMEVTNEEKPNQDYGDDLVLNVEQSEIDCINLD